MTHIDVCKKCKRFYRENLIEGDECSTLSWLCEQNAKLLLMNVMNELSFQSNIDGVLKCPFWMEHTMVNENQKIKRTKETAKYMNLVKQK